MGTQNIEQKGKNHALIYLIKILAGPLACIILMQIPIDGLDNTAKLTLGVYLWMIVWWCTEALPWAITSMMPLLLLPPLGVLKLTEVTSLIYGQRIFFLMIFVFIMSGPIKRSGLGQRIAMNLLSIKWINGSLNRFVLVFMFASAILNALFSIAGSVIIAPVGMATLDHIFNEYEKNGVKHDKTKVGAYVILGGLYGAIAGGFCTLHAIPHNVMVLSLMEEINAITTSYMQWTLVGVPLAIVFVLVGYFVLRLIYGKHAGEIPGGVQYFRAQKLALGKLTRPEIVLGATLGVTIALWASTTFFTLPGIDFYWVSYLGILALFIIPSDVSKKQGLATMDDFKSMNWNIILLITAAVGYSSLLEKVGIITYISNLLQNVSGTALQLIAAYVTPVMTNFLPGMASAVTMSTIVLPLTEGAGINPAVIARIIPAMSMGFIFPWAGTMSAIYFGTGKVTIKEMAKTGIIITLVLATLAMFLGGALLTLFGAYTPM